MCRSQCSAVSGPSELCLRHSGGQCQTHMQSSTRCSHRKPKWSEESEGGGRRNGGRRITSFPPKGKSVFTKISETTLTVAQTCFFLQDILLCLPFPGRFFPLGAGQQNSTKRAGAFGWWSRSRRRGVAQCQRQSPGEYIQEKNKRSEEAAAEAERLP